MFGNSFLQKIVISMFVGACLAGLVSFYRNIIQAGDDALNKNYRKKPAAAQSGVPTPVPRQVVPQR